MSNMTTRTLTGKNGSYLGPHAGSFEDTSLDYEEIYHIYYDISSVT